MLCHKPISIHCPIMWYGSVRPSPSALHQELRDLLIKNTLAYSKDGDGRIWILTQIPSQ